MQTFSPHDLDFAAWVRPGDRLAWGQCAAEPLTLTRALFDQRHRIGGRFSVFLGITWGDAVRPECADVVDFQAYGGGGVNRALAEAGVLDVLCCHYSDFERALGAEGLNQVDVLLLQVAPPGPDGRYSLSIAHEYVAPLVDSARLVIAEVNEAAPWTYGTRSLGPEDIDVLVPTNRPLPEPSGSVPTIAEGGVATNVASLVDDGATLQLGIGALPDAVLSRLFDRRDLGIHSGAVGDGVATLSELGVITNACKSIDRGVTIAGVLMGGPHLHAFAHLNPRVQMRSTAYTHSAVTLASIDRLVSINSAIEIDLTGQVNAESAGGRYLGAVGGAIDFIRGARLSRGGLSIIALPSRAGTRSRIVPRLAGPVSTPRGDIGLVVTEHGIADLRGATIAQRIRRLLDIAHPEDRAELEAAVHNARRTFP